jgi:HD-like signal output (HDOD) protein
MSLPAAELALFGTDHGELGALVARHWGLPDALVDAIRTHHRAELAPPENRRVALIVQLADELWSSTKEGDVGEGIGAVDELMVQELSLDPAALPALLEGARTATAEATTLLA